MLPVSQDVQAQDQSMEQGSLGTINRVVAVRRTSEPHEIHEPPPKSTMKRIVTSSSKPGSIVLDNRANVGRRLLKSKTKFPWEVNNPKKRKLPSSTPSSSFSDRSQGSNSIDSMIIANMPNRNSMSFDNYAMLFFDTYDPWRPSPAPSPEQKHQVNMLSSLDIFLKTRLRQDDSVCGPIAVEGDEVQPTIYEKPFTKFWAVHNLLETGKIPEAFTALDEWCEIIQMMLKSQQPPLISLLSVMSFEFNNLNKPEIADKVLNFLTSAAEVYFGKRHPLSVMIWCLRASNKGAEVALPELALERAVKQLGKMDHKHIALLLEDVKYRYAQVLRQRGKIEESVLILRGMAEDNERTYGSLSSKAMEPLYTIGRTYYDAESNPQAKEAFEAILQRVGESPGLDNTWLRTGSHGRLAQICKRLGYDLQARHHALTALNESFNLNDECQQRSVWLTRFERDKIL